MTPPDPPRDRFREMLRLKARRGGVLSREEEERLLEEGILRADLSLEDSRALLLAAAEEGGLVLERGLDDATRELLGTLAGPRGRVARDDFEAAAKFYRARTGRALSEQDARQRVKRVMETAGLGPARAGPILPTTRWYRAI